MLKNLIKNFITWLKPQNIKTLSGNGPKGNYKIKSIFDESGNLVKRISSYKKNNVETKYIRDYKPNNTSIRTVKSVNGRIESFTKKEIRRGSVKEGNILYTENTIYRDSPIQHQKIIHCTKGKKAEIIEWDTSWDGKAPELKYKNMPKILEGQDGIASLPADVDITNFSRFKHLYKYQLKQQGLEGIFSDFRILTQNDLRQQFPEIKQMDDAVGVGGFFCEKRGIICCVLGQRGAAEELIAHEVQHARDWFDMARLENSINTELKNFSYFSVARKKGIIKKANEPKKYEELDNLLKSELKGDYEERVCRGEHSEIPIEKRAIEKEITETLKSMKLWQLMTEYFKI